MESFSDNVPPDDERRPESQSSQILNFALGGRRGRPPAAARTPDGTKIGPLTSASRENASVEQSGGSASGGDRASSASTSSVRSRYHYHGLANSQSQSQSQVVEDTFGDYDEDSESQKENAPRSTTGVTGAPSPSANKAFTADTPVNEALTSLHHHEASLTPPVPLRNFNSHSSLTTTHQQHQQGQQPKVVKFLSPSRPASPEYKSAPLASGGMHFLERSSSPNSQDSFAGPSSLQDPDLFLASAKQFDRPVDMLGIPDSQENTGDNTRHRGRQMAADNNGQSTSGGGIVGLSDMAQYSLSSTSQRANDGILVPSSDGGHESEDNLSHAVAPEVVSTNEVNEPELIPTQIVGSTSIDLRLSLSSSMMVENEMDNFSLAIERNSLVSQKSAFTNLNDTRRDETVIVPDSERDSMTEDDSLEGGVVPPTPSEPTTSIREARSVERTRLQQREEEEEEDVVRDVKGKGKGKEVMVNIGGEDGTDGDVEMDDVKEVKKGVKSKAANGRKPPLGMKGKTKQTTTTRGKKAPRKSATEPNEPLNDYHGETTVNPKVEPGADVGSTSTRQTRSKAAAIMKGKGRATPKPETNISALRRATPKVVLSGQAARTPLQLSARGTGTESPEVPLAVRKREDDEATVLDNRIHDDVQPEQSIASTTRKRRRSPVASVGNATRLPKSTASRAGSLSAPPTKRIKTEFLKIPTRVLALWKQDGYYYFGTVDSVDSENPSRYKICFDDGTEEFVEISKLRVGDPRVGEILLLNQGKTKKKVKIVNADAWVTQKSLTVSMVNDDDGETLDVEANDVQVAGRAVDMNWADRILNAKDIVTVAGLKHRNASAPTSVMDGTHIPKSKALLGCAIAITLPVDLVEQRDFIIHLITNLGGVVISDWSEVYTLQGKHVSGNKRWIIVPDDIKFKGKGIDRLFLLSDGSSTRPKFLSALALGIPCVHFDWLDALSRGEDADWKAFLLTAGLSERLNARFTQIVDFDWGDCVEHISTIMSNPVPLKVLNEAKVLCLGNEFLPPPPKKNINDYTLEGNYAIPRIALFMGASYVEAVADVKQASDRDITTFGFVVIKDSPPLPLVQGARYVTVEWLKECLIANRLFEVPAWQS